MLRRFNVVSLLLRLNYTLIIKEEWPVSEVMKEILALDIDSILILEESPQTDQDTVLATGMPGKYSDTD